MNEPDVGRIDRRSVAKGAAATLGGSIVVLGLAARGDTSVAQEASPVASPIASPVTIGVPVIPAATPVDLPDGGTGAPMFRGNPARTGEMPGAGPDPANGVEFLWSVVTGGSVWSAPAVVDGVVYTGSADSNVYALDAVTSRERWRFVTGNGVFSSPAVVDGVVYIGSGDANVYALDAATGAERWRFGTSGGVFSSPAVVDGVVYIGGEDSNVYALDAVSGRELWRFGTDDYVYSSPALVDGVVYVGGWDGNIYALDAALGTEVWRFDADQPVRSSPAVVDGVVYVGGYTSNIYALDAALGTEIWRFPVGGVWSSPAVVDGVVYIGGLDANIYALDADSGRERWRFATGTEVWSSPAVADGVVYSGSEDANVYALDATSGSEVWRVTTGTWVTSSPTVVDGVVYVGSGDTYIYAISAREPRLEAGGVARVTAPTSLRGGPAATAVERAGLVAGATVSITGGSETTDDIVWWPVTVAETGDQGWVEADVLEPIANVPSGSDGGDGAFDGAFMVGQRVIVNDDGVNLRGAAATDGDIVATLDPGQILTIVNGPFEADAYVWWQVIVDRTEELGFVVEEFLEAAAP